MSPKWWGMLKAWTRVTEKSNKRCMELELAPASVQLLVYEFDLAHSGNSNLTWDRTCGCWITSAIMHRHTVNIQYHCNAKLPPVFHLAVFLIDRSLACSAFCTRVTKSDVLKSARTFCPTSRNFLGGKKLSEFFKIRFTRCDKPRLLIEHCAYFAV